MIEKLLVKGESKVKLVIDQKNSKSCQLKIITWGGMVQWPKLLFT